MSSESLTPGVRRQVIERANGCCEYCLCQQRFSPASFSIEHITPQSQGKTSTLSNLALACQGCNSYKFTCVSAIDPVSLQEVSLFNPRTDVWSENFTWTEDFTEIIGLTACARATIARLRLNRPPVVALRRILAGAGLHPPIYPYARLNS